MRITNQIHREIPAKILFRKDLNFLIYEQNKSTKSGLSFTALVFVCSFIIVFGTLNFPFLSDQLVYLFEDDNTEESFNTEIANMYKQAIDQDDKTYLLPVALDLVVNNTNDAPVEAERPISQELNSNYISISKINVKAPIIVATSSSGKYILQELKKGVVLYPGSSLPSQSGMAVIIGHSSSNFPITKYSAIFAKLSKLEAGDIVTINFDGKTYTYSVDKKETGSASNLANAASNSDLVLGSCWPVGTDKGRIIVTANLQEI